MNHFQVSEEDAEDGEKDEKVKWKLKRRTWKSYNRALHEAWCYVKGKKAQFTSVLVYEFYSPQFFRMPFFHLIKSQDTHKIDFGIVYG